MSLTIRCRSAPFTTSCTRPSPLHAPSPLGKTSPPSASGPTTRSSRPAGCAGHADVASTYCYLLSSEEHRDADTWGVRLLELSERSLRPDATIADFAGGLRAGQAEALPDVPCRGDVFHALQTATPLVGYLENRAYEAIATRSRLENRQARAEHRQGRKDASLVGQLRYAREAEAQAVTLAEDVALLVRWLQHDAGWRCAAPTTSAAVPCMTGSWRNCGCASRTAPTAFDRSAVCWRINGTPCWPSRNNSTGISRRWQRSSRFRPRWSKKSATC